MFIVNNYPLAVALCFVTMLCWGSWANTQKLASRSWRYELFYWDYALGVLLLSAILGFTLGSIGEEGRSFLADLKQVSRGNFWSAVTGGIIFNASNILLSASISIAGMAVAFPLGVGLALVLGVAINYAQAPKGDLVILTIGVVLVVIAILVNGIASGKHAGASKEKNKGNKGIWIALAAGLLMSLFYRFVAKTMDLENLENPAPGMLAPYAAFFIFSLGLVASNIVFNTILMKKPFVGEPVSYRQYFSGNMKTHLVGILGGIIWGIGTAFSFIAAGKAGAAISYGLGQTATLVAALWGVFIWKEFKGASKSVNRLLFMMFIFFLSGLLLIIFSGN